MEELNDSDMAISLKEAREKCKDCKHIKPHEAKIPQGLDESGNFRLKQTRSSVLEDIRELLNKSVVTYRAASFWGASDYKCVELLMEKDSFEELEKMLNVEIKGRIGKQYEGNE